MPEQPPQNNPDNPATGHSPASQSPRTPNSIVNANAYPNGSRDRTPSSAHSSSANSAAELAAQDFAPPPQSLPSSLSNYPANGSPNGSPNGMTNSSIATAPFMTNLRHSRYRNSSVSIAWIVFAAVIVMFAGLVFNLSWLGLAGAIVALFVSLRVVGKAVLQSLAEIISPEQQVLTVSILGLIAAVLGLLQLTGLSGRLSAWYASLNWDAIGATGEVIGAVGQILIAILAVYVAWRQYVISKDLTIQQNLITQQQTIDSYFQGISELVLDEEGLLEDWPQERAIAEGRTAAILSSIDGQGKAKVIRFLSRSRLLSPLKRDRLLGRAILDGAGGYEEDREHGVRVIDLGVMLAGANLAGTDLRWTDLSDINLIRVNLAKADLVKANLARTILCNASLAGADMIGVRLFYGSARTASPRTRDDIPNYQTGEFTGAVIEDADLTNVQRLSEEQRYYCCAWGGSHTRSTIPGGCEGIPNLLER